MRTHGTYRYDMQFAVNGNPIPDPYEYSGTESDLDTEAERDATGYLHRRKVATKHPLKIKWQNIDWWMIEYILGLVKEGAQDRFQFTCIDPAVGPEPVTRTCYAGDREWSCEWIPGGDYREGLGNLSFSVIEF